MLRSLLVGLAITASVLAPAAANAQVVELDLSKGGDITKPAPPGTIDVVLINLLPWQDYKVTIIDRIIEIPALKMADVAGSGASAPACSAIVTAAEKLTDQAHQPASEAEVASIIAKVRSDMKTVTCSADQKQQIEKAIGATRRDLGHYTIGAGHELVVTVVRKAGDKNITWTFTLQGESRGKWLTTYGMTLVTDRDQKFFTKATGATGSGAYAITQEQNPARWDLKPAPSVFFTWLSQKNQDRDWARGWTAGFGLDGGSKPAVYAGYSATYNWNIGFVTGVAFTPETRINGRYTVGQTVAEDLGAEALQKTTSRPRWFVAITYRFGDNPFASKPAAEAPDKSKAKKE